MWRTKTIVRVICACVTVAIAFSSIVACCQASTGDATGANELRVMSFNVRYSRGVPQEPAAENDWNDADHPRRERAVRVIRDCVPDVLGVQEARELQVNDLREALPEFEFYGIGRDDGKTGGEFAGIFYRKDRFTRTDAGTFWLSATPEKPGTSFYTVPGAVPRIASWVRLHDNQSGRELLVLNTHFDHISSGARRKSAALIRQRLSKLAEGIPAIVMGDFNTPEDSAPLRTLVGEAAAGRRLIDSYRAVHRDRSPDESTFNHWRGTTEGSRIDFILPTEELTPTAAAIVRTNYDGRWPSDHYPVTATLRLAVAQH
jgi:endonuclease/exonuclease/phosphatase family metal-dependent hydrolase